MGTPLLKYVEGVTELDLISQHNLDLVVFSYILDGAVANPQLWISSRERVLFSLTIFPGKAESGD